MKRIFCLALCLLLLLGIIPVAAFALDTGRCGENLSWTLDEEGILTISGTGDMWDWAEGDAPWYDRCGDITEVVIESGVTSVGAYAFAGCYWLQTAEIGSDVERIGFGAFQECTDLAAVNFPAKLTLVEAYTFWDCKSLQSVILGPNVTEIKASAFLGCSALKELWIPKSISKIGSLAFRPMEIQDVYFEGDADAWNGLGFNAPQSIRIHYACESPSTHWTPYCAGQWCGCGYTRISDETPGTGAHVYNRKLTEDRFKATDATCKAPATYYFSCFCGAVGDKTFQAGDVKPHEYSAVVTDPSCTSEGYTTHTCGCGESYVDSHVDARGHSWKDATCTVPRTCSACAATEGNAKGHSWEDATCIAPKTCSNCHATEGSPKGHKWNDATCTVPKTCAVCKATEGSAKGHSWQNATCTTPMTCSVCNTTEGSAKGHKWNDATCTEPRNCKTCGTIDGSALGHSWEAATCTAPQTCAVCDATQGSAKGHDWENATCTRPKTCTLCGSTEGEANGHRWYAATCITPEICKFCGVSDGSALGHSWLDATCTEPKTCSVCKTTEGNPKGHNWLDATCTAPKTCSVCTATEGNPKGHGWVDASCTAPKTCSVCNATEGTAIAHTYDQEKTGLQYLVSEATCTSLAVYRKSCQCGAAGEETFTAGERKPHLYKDVPGNTYYHDAVVWAAENDVTTGTGDGTTFEPNKPCTRGQVVTFLWRTAGQPEPTGTENPFVDVKSGDYFYKAVLWAKENNITSGTGDGSTFEPNAACNRAQIVTFLSRAKNGKATTGDNPFRDIAENAYYYNPVLWAVEKGITTGTGDGTTFEPGKPCTRGQVITFLWRACTK